MGFWKALRSFVPRRAEPRPQDNRRMSTSGHRNTAQNILQLAEGWTSAEAEALLGRCQVLALQRPPEGTGHWPGVWPEAGVKGGYWATEQDLPRKLWPLTWRKTIQSGHEARVSPPGLAFEW